MVWRQHSPAENNVVDAHITNLRKKIDDKDRLSRIANIRRFHAAAVNFCQ